MKRLVRRDISYPGIQNPQLAEYISDDGYRLVLLPFYGLKRYAVWCGWFDCCIGTVIQHENGDWLWEIPSPYRQVWGYDTLEDALADLLHKWIEMRNATKESVGGKS